MDYTAFSHGQIQSKLWLCEELEKIINGPIKVAVIGCWHGLTGFLLLSRNKHLYKIENIDIDQASLDVARKVNDAWMILENSVQLTHADINKINFDNHDLIINTSVEDVESIEWYTNIPSGKLVCLQSLNLNQDDIKNYDNWKILNPNVTFDDFKKKFPLSTTLYEGTKEFNYGHLKYTRFMIIGIK